MAKIKVKNPVAELDGDEMISDTAEEFKSNITSTKLPVEITNAQSMEAHVRDVAMKATGRS